MIAGVELWVAATMALASIWLQATPQDDAAMVGDARLDDVAVLASLLIV